MKCFSASRAILVLALWDFAFLSSQGLGQSQPRSNSETPRIRSRVDLVLADTLVIDSKSARPASGLTKEDFMIFEDGVRQQISHFSQDSLPLSIMILVDRGGCLDPFSDSVRQATRTALGRLKPEDEVALMAFSDDATLVHEFTQDKDRIVSAMDRLPEHESFGGHCFNRALDKAAQYVRSSGNPDGRRVILMITAQTTGFAYTGPSVRDVTRTLQEAGTVVCGLLPRSIGQRLESGVYRAGTGLTSALRLGRLIDIAKLAAETGGEIFNEPADRLPDSFEELIQHLRSRYTIGFVSTNSSRDGKYRKLRLQLSPEAENRSGKLLIRTRRGYYAVRESTGADH
ncbi:MAG TPA: VWA domain-containing protein [Acidobacteriota bacterium]